MSASAHASPHASGTVLLVAAAGCLSGSAVLISASGVAPVSAAVLRTGLALVPLAPLVLMERRRAGSMPARLRAYALVAGVALGIDFSCWNVSVVEAGAGVATVLVNVQVIVLPALSWLLDRTGIPRRVWVVAPVMLAGVGLSGGLLDLGTRTPHPRGILLGLAAGTAYACYLYVIRRGGHGAPRRPFGVLATACASACATAAVVALATGDAELPASARSWAMMIALASFGQVAAFALINRGTARLAPEVASPLLLLPAVFAVPMAGVALDEVPSVAQVAGCAIVVAAAWYATARRPSGRGRPGTGANLVGNELRRSGHGRT